MEFIHRPFTRRAVLSSGVAFFIGILAGCGSSIPSDADAKKFYEETSFLQFDTLRYWIKAEVARVRSIRKTNGQASERNGVKVYRFDYEVEVEFIQPVEMPGGGPGHKVGDIVKDTGSITFELTEKGWEGVSWTRKGQVN